MHHIRWIALVALLNGTGLIVSMHDSQPVKQCNVQQNVNPLIEQLNNTARTLDEYMYNPTLNTTGLIEETVCKHDQIFRLLISNNKDRINETDQDGNTALMFAAHFWLYRSIELLLVAGAHRDIHNEHTTAATIASRYLHKHESDRSCDVQHELLSQLSPATLKAMIKCVGLLTFKQPIEGPESLLPPAEYIRSPQAHAHLHEIVNNHTTTLITLLGEQKRSTNHQRRRTRDTVELLSKSIDKNTGDIMASLQMHYHSEDKITSVPTNDSFQASWRCFPL